MLFPPCRVLSQANSLVSWLVFKWRKPWLRYVVHSMRDHYTLISTAEEKIDR